MSEITTAVLEWLSATGAPNALVVLALLTSPATWSRRAAAFVRDRFSASD